MAATLKRVDAREFDELASKTGLGEAAREMARLVLVEGKTMPEAAELCGTYKQRVSLAVGSIRRVHQNAAARSGWVSLEMEVPQRLSVQLMALLTALKASNSSAAAALVLSEIERALEKARQTLLERSD